MEKVQWGIVAAIICVVIAVLVGLASFSVGYGSGHSTGYMVGYDNGHTEGHAIGRDEGYLEGYTIGYENGYEEGKKHLIYYDIARDYVSTNYAPVGEKTIVNLVAFLDQIKFRDYEKSVFDCSEASAMLEWLLEGADFSVSIASNYSYFFSHTWVLVTLNDGNIVVIDATGLTSNNYAPPGIIEAPDGCFREYTYEYKMFLEWKEKYSPDLYTYDPNITFEEWKLEYLIWVPSFLPSRETYYNPPKIYDSLVEAITDYERSEWDWWNVSPYSSTYPFSKWN